METITLNKRYSSNTTNCLVSDYHKNLFGEINEEPRYLTGQLLTYIGNKRSLISKMEPVVNHVKGRLGKDRLRILDAFSGSGIVARYFKRHADYLAAIDIEDYAAVVSRCYCFDNYRRILISY